MEEDYIIQTWDFSKLYNANAGFKSISLQVPKGVVFGFLGPNGAGKSTFVRTLLGLLKPTGGKGELLGHPPGNVSVLRQIGYLPELFRYPDWMTGIQLLSYHGELCHHIPYRELKRTIPILLDRVGLLESGNEKIKNYSKGMQQRIGIACALIGDPRLIFLDEPTSALDPIGRKEVRELIAELQNKGKTIFLNSHLLSEVENGCDHVAIIHKGEMVIQGEWRKLSSIEIKIEIHIGMEKEPRWNLLSPSLHHIEKERDINGRQVYTLSLQAEKDIPVTLSQLIAQGITIYQVIEQKPHLEDVFMYWVNRKERGQHVDNYQNDIQRNVL